MPPPHTHRHFFLNVSFVTLVFWYLYHRYYLTLPQDYSMWLHKPVSQPLDTLADMQHQPERLNLSGAI